MSPSSGSQQGRGGGRARRGDGQEGDASPEWLPPRQRQELETSRVTQSGRAGLQQLGGGADGRREAEVVEERERLAMMLHRQQGGLWVPGPNVGANRDDEGGANDEEEEGDDVPLVQLAGDDRGLLELPTLEQVHQQHISTHKWPPKAARRDFTRELTATWNKVTDHPEEEKNWLLMMMFPKVILFAGSCHKMTNPTCRGKTKAREEEEAGGAREKLRGEEC